MRIDATVPAQWRFAPGGKGTGDYVRGSLTDISRSGASLIVDREVKKGTFVETRFSVSTAAAPLVLLGEVMRSSAIESSKKTIVGSSLSRGEARGRPGNHGVHQQAASRTAKPRIGLRGNVQG